MRRSLIKSGVYSFPKEMRLSKKEKIKEIFRKGRKFSFDGSSLFVAPNEEGVSRFLCTFRRGFGTAVQRNRVRRVVREIYRKSQFTLKKGVDLIFLPSEYCGDSHIWSERVKCLFEMAGIAE